MAKIRSAAAVRKKIRALVYGAQFSGKSTWAMQAAYLKRPDGKPYRILFLDTEGGSIDNYVEEMVENGVQPENFLIIYTQSLAEVQDYIKLVTNQEDIVDEDDNVILDADGEPFRADCIIIDSVTVLNVTTRQKSAVAA